ncbi:hypothetical protein FGO68_gene9846 [Halteria grandinella]|uniref:Uncharacterized protein n=1 Tax=Halteria grandinella TaxID=5974 RepID=A0A8J8NNQ9_HALGN|nr:hypothetical protein FGO68_gene9846 [Halteria grandinella]
MKVSHFEEQNELYQQDDEMKVIQAYDNYQRLRSYHPLDQCEPLRNQEIQQISLDQVLNQRNTYIMLSQQQPKASQVSEENLVEMIQNFQGLLHEQRQGYTVNQSTIQASWNRSKSIQRCKLMYLRRKEGDQRYGGSCWNRRSDCDRTQ